MDWYEELDYEENPFKDNEETELIGYEDFVDDVLYRLASGSMVCVEGKSGAGKTAILKAAINKFKGSGRVVYINGQQLQNGLNIEKILKKNAGLMKRLFNKKPQEMILLLDEVQNLSEKNCERIKYYFDNNFIKSAVFTSSDFNKVNFTQSLKERISKTIKLREITEDEAIDIVQSRLGSDEIIPEDVIKDIFSRSNKNMKTFLKNCEKICSFALENNGKKVLPEHIKDVFEETQEEPIKESEESQENENKNTPKKTKKSKTDKKPTKKEKIEDPKQVIEEPISVAISNDFKPEKKGKKMEDETKEEEIDIDNELKKLSKANKLDEEEDLELDDYEEDYDDFKETDDEEDEDEIKKVSKGDDDIAEKYY